MNSGNRFVWAVSRLAVLGAVAVVLAPCGVALASRAEESPSDKPAAEQPAQPPTAEKPAAADTAQPAVTTGCVCRACDCCCRRIILRNRCRVRVCCNRCVPVAVGQTGGPSKPDRYAWRDLFDGKSLKNWTPTDFGGQGKVEVRDGMIVMEMGNAMTGITWAGGDLPRDNYELQLEGMRLEGSDFFCTTTFPVGKEPCTLVVGGWGGTVVGLSNVDGYDASDNPTTTFQTFKDKTWYKVRIRVSTSKIEVWIDDKKLISQKREGHKFGIRFECEPCQPLGIATWSTSGAVRDIRLRELTPEEVKAIAAEKDDVDR